MTAGTPHCQLCGRAAGPGAQRFRVARRAPAPSAGDLLVCGECARTRPRCVVCGVPGASDLAGESPVCAVCAATLPRCRACGQHIAGRYAEIEGAGPYCLACVSDRPVCDVCGAPLGSEAWRLADGRVLCAVCHATAVYDTGSAQQVYAEVAAAARRLLGLALNVPTGLALVDQAQLVDIIRRQNGSSPHEPERTLGVYARTGIRRGIYVQTGLPRALLLQVAAHEFGHAWQGENCPLLRDPLRREGFAEWVAYKLLEARGLARHMRAMMNRTDLYGEGLRWALAAEAHGGASAVIAACRAHD